MRERGRGPAGVRRSACGRTACATWCCSAWAAPRWPRRCCGAASPRRPALPRLTRARLDRRGHDRARCRARSTPPARCSSSPPSPGHDRAAVAVRAFLLARPTRRQLRRDHRSGLGPGGARARARLPGGVPRRPRHRRALLGAVGVRDRAGRADGGGRARRCSRAPTAPGGRRWRAIGPSSRPCARRRSRAPPAWLWLGAALSALARAGPRQADVPDRSLAAGPRPVARAAGGGVDRQARARASCRWPRSRRASPTATARIACSCGSPIRPARGGRGLGRAGARARVPRLCAGGPSGDRDAGRRTGRSRAPVPAGRAGRRGRRLGPSDQPLRPAQRAAGQGRDQPRARLRRGDARAARDRRRRRGRAAARCSRGLAPPDYVAIMGYVQPSAEFDAAVAELRAAIRDATQGRRRRSATDRASCTRPASSTRAGRRRALPAAAARRARRTSRSPAAATRSPR